MNEQMGRYRSRYGYVPGIGDGGAGMCVYVGYETWQKMACGHEYCT